MSRDKALQIIQQEHLPSGHFTLLGSCAACMQGVLKREERDIDIGVDKYVWDLLKQKHTVTVRQVADGKYAGKKFETILLSDDGTVEAFPLFVPPFENYDLLSFSHLIYNLETGPLPVTDPEIILAIKRDMNRTKDKADCKEIETKIHQTQENEAFFKLTVSMIIKPKKLNSTIH